ncbi:alpha/beta fold hydrolase [Pseudoduganella sp. FT93W]|uniref:Alpha/beta fold hydrolase n=1 Tax=Duganella fentianensis TaxID=2692177 RepID=A0A845I0N7_9BURK|nr:alpha/beta hydrolase [Duganella fentianensis]MYN46692.1 alpha/beta fold hydrolase [Duganella fentianensis]
MSMTSLSLAVLLSVPALLLLLLLAAERIAPLPMARAAMALERARCGLRRHGADEAMPFLQGGAGEVLVLVHGFGADKDNFTRIAPYLTPHYRVLLPDLPGFGEAGRDPLGHYSIADQVEHLRTFLERHAGPGPVHLGGNSMGGFIVAQFAARYPERVASLWLLDAAGTAAAQDSQALRGYRDSGALPLLVREEADFSQMLAYSRHRHFFLPYAVRTALARRAAADFGLHEKIMQQVAASPLLEQQYRTLGTPALIVWGERDRILHPAGAAALAALYAEHHSIMMADIGHLPMLEAPRRCAADYRAFRQQLAQRGAAGVRLTASA